MNKVIVLIPFYNESKNLNEFKKLIQYLDKFTLDFKFVFCDDNSDDGTAVSLSNFLNQNNQNYEIIKNNTNLGHGGSLIRLSKLDQIKYYDFVLTLDFDFCYLHDDLEKILISIVDNKIIIGKRKYFDEGLFRQLLSTCSEIIILLKSFVAFRDTNSPIRLYPTNNYLDIWKQIPENTLIPNIFSTLIMLKNMQSFSRVLIRKNKNLIADSVTWGNGIFSKKLKIILFSFESFKQLIIYK
jgi:glycosyltransferase involved in cell wall biosynthesis